jgi:hypothetical protein
MASVFLSYEHEDAPLAAPIASALEKAGHSVWWDRHIDGGAEYNSAIESAVQRADVVVVLWSERSVKSAWVRDEAAEGRDGGKLVPLTVDDARPPMGFRQFQTIDLPKTKLRRGGTKMRELVEAVDKFAAAKQSQAIAAEVPKRGARDDSFGRRRMAILVAALALITAMGVAIWHYFPPTSAPLIVAVRPAEQTAAARGLARELLVKLGSAQSGAMNSIQIVDESASRRPDLILEISGGGLAETKSANLVLFRGPDRQLLSSQDLAPSEAVTGDLETSIVIAAADAIGCATEALATRPPPPLDVLKQYLGACERFHALYGMEDVSILIPQLEQIVSRRPRFLPAWRQLLLAGAYARAMPSGATSESPQWLRAKVDEARRIGPEMPELRLAELELLPMTDFRARLHLVDSLRDSHPDNMFVLGARAEQLMLVGLNNEAVVDAERAARLDPYSAYSRSEYIRTLAFSGRLSRAFEELDNFKPFSPVAMSLADTRFRVNMRYGDPESALAILRMYGTSKAHDAFLAARVKPTAENIQRALANARASGFYSTRVEVLQAFGRGDEVFELLMRAPIQRLDQSTLQTLFRPTLKNFRQNPRFLRIAQRLGLLNYWRKSGNWPDFCFEPGLPYDCKAEAAKLN